MSGSSSSNSAAGGSGGSAGAAEGIAYDREDLIRLINQSLRALGFESIADRLQQESQVTLESEAVLGFRRAVNEGNWDEACRVLDTLQQTYPIDDRHVKSLLFKEKYLELVEAGHLRDALVCLRRELTPRSTDPSLLHLLGQALILPEAREMRALLRWPGTGPNRAALLRGLERGPCSRWLLPHHRLDVLVRQALQAQRAACLYHNTQLPVMSLLFDHSCQRSAIPHRLTATLTKHTDEVWYLRFSHSGTMLATCSKDGRCIVWDMATLAPRFVLVGHSTEVEYCEWSPDDTMLLTCGARGDRLVLVWCMRTGECLRRLLAHENSVTALAWSADGGMIISASLDQRINFWDAKLFKVVHTWAPVRATAMAATCTGKLVVVCYEHKLHIYSIEKREEIFCQLESSSVTSVCVTRDGREALVGLLNGELHLWSIEGEVGLVRKFSGHTNGHYILRSCFGGADEDFVVSGSEDGQVYVWHRRTAKLLERIEGHEGSVNAVAWSPTDFSVMASVGDDHTVRIWGQARPAAGANGHSDDDEDDDEDGEYESSSSLEYGSGEEGGQSTRKRTYSP